MNKYLIKVILIKRLIIFLILSILFVNGSAILTYLYISETIYPGIVFLISIIISYFIGSKILQTEVQIKITDTSIYFDKIKCELSELISYSFDNTNFIYKALFNFSPKKIRLYVLLKHGSEYVRFKNDIENKIISKNLINIHKIAEYNWYKTKSAKLYGYVTAFVLVLWIAVMILYPEKLTLSNIAFFLLVLAGISPILFKIFGNEKSR